MDLRSLRPARDRSLTSQFDLCAVLWLFTSPLARAVKAQKGPSIQGAGNFALAPRKQFSKDYFIFLLVCIWSTLCQPWGRMIYI